MQTAGFTLGLCNLEIHTLVTQPRDGIYTIRRLSLEIGMQLLDSENAQHNLKIAQIPRLCNTYHSSIGIVGLVPILE